MNEKTKIRGFRKPTGRRSGPIGPFIALALTLALIAGCAGGLQLSDDSNSRMGAYFAGKGMAIALYKLLPDDAADIDADLGIKWDALMARNVGVEMAPAEEMMFFYNDSIAVIGTYTNDPYGLIGDLGMLLTTYGAEFNENNEIIALQPMPMAVLKYFGLGFDNGRMVAQN